MTTILHDLILHHTTNVAPHSLTMTLVHAHLPQATRRLLVAAGTIRTLRLVVAGMVVDMAGIMEVVVRQLVEGMVVRWLVVWIRMLVIMVRVIIHHRPVRVGMAAMAAILHSLPILPHPAIHQPVLPPSPLPPPTLQPPPPLLVLIPLALARPAETHLPPKPAIDRHQGASMRAVLRLVLRLVVRIAGRLGMATRMVGRAGMMVGL